MPSTVPRAYLYIGLSLIALSFVVRFVAESMMGEGTLWTVMASPLLVWGVFMVWGYARDVRKSRKQQ